VERVNLEGGAGDSEGVKIRMIAVRWGFYSPAPGPDGPGPGKDLAGQGSGSLGAVMWERL